MKDKRRRCASGCWPIGLFGTCLSSLATASSPRPSRCCRRWRADVVSPAFRKVRDPAHAADGAAGLFAVQKRARRHRRLRADHGGGSSRLVALGIHIVPPERSWWRSSPHYALASSGASWRLLIILGAVVLCVTGGEALYADMGHFGRRADPHHLVSIVMPCLTEQAFARARCCPSRGGGTVLLAMAPGLADAAAGRSLANRWRR